MAGRSLGGEQDESCQGHDQQDRPGQPVAGGEWVGGALLMVMVAPCCF